MAFTTLTETDQMETEMRAYDVYVKGEKASTMVRLLAANRMNALAQFAFPRGLKTIQCEAIFRSKKYRGVS